MKASLLAGLIFMLPLSLFGADRALMLGGACEPPLDNGSSSPNRFIPVMSEQIRGLKKHGWSVDTLFHGEGKNDTAEFQKFTKLDPTLIQDLTKQSVLDSLDHALASLNRDDQLLISMNAHGEPSLKNGQNHAICLRAENDHGQTQFVTLPLDDPDLVMRFKSLKAKGIRMGFVDMSCYGGGSIPELSSYGCVMASQPQNRISLGYGVAGSLARILNESPHKLKNLDVTGDHRISLDEVFLDVLANGHRYKTKNARPDTDTPVTIAQISGMEELNHSGEAFLELLSDASEQAPRIPMRTAQEACFVIQQALMDINTFFETLGKTTAGFAELEKYQKAFAELSGDSPKGFYALKASLPDDIRRNSAAFFEYRRLAEKRETLAHDMFSDEATLGPDSKKGTLELAQLQRAMDEVRAANPALDTSGAHIPLSRDFNEARFYLYLMARERKAQSECKSFTILKTL